MGRARVFNRFWKRRTTQEKKMINKKLLYLLTKKIKVGLVR